MSESNPLALESADTASEAPAAEQSGPQLGSDLFTEDQPAAPVEQTGAALPKTAKTGPQTAADLETMDLSRVKVEDLPPELQPAARYIKRMQADYTRKTQDLAAQRQEAQAERQQYLDAVQRLQQPAQGKQDAQDPIETLAARLERPEDRQGLYVVRELFNAQLAQAIAPIQQQLQQLTQTVPALQQSVGAMTAQQKTAINEAVGAELKAAHEAFGEDTVKTYGQAILALYGQTNPQTEKPYTVSELVGLLSGRAAAEVQTAQEQTVETKRQAKAKAGGPRATQPAARGNGQLSRREAEQQIGAIFGK